ncbi:MAG: alpha/beta hydrolase [Alphaproteobacteria bacterium]
MKIWKSRLRWLVPALLALVVVAIAAGPVFLRAVETADALGAISQVARQGEIDAAGPYNRPGPRAQQVSYLIDGRFRTADLYLGEEAPIASLVLVPGADVLGREHPQFRALAGVLSSLGFAVLVPHMENLQQLRIRAGDVTHIADAARNMARFAPVDAGPSVGVLAVSYGVGPAVLAALEEEARAHIRYVLGIGGYYDLEAVLTFLTTGHFRPRSDAEWREADPHAHGKWVFLASNADFLENPQDQVTLRVIARRKFADAQAEVGDLTEMLTPQGKAVFDLITNTDPARVPKLIRDLPEGALEHLRALDVSDADLSGLRARLILVHGRDDHFIPHTESRALARAAKGSPGGASLYVIDRMAHIRMSASGLGDGWKLYRAVYALLAQRDAAPEPEIPPALVKPVDLQDPDASG